MTFPASLPEPASPYSTKEGWSEQFALHLCERTTPTMPSDWKRLSSPEKDRFNELRRDHHNSFGPILTPSLRKMNEDLCNLARVNLRRVSGARPGAVIDGLANLGKTTRLVYFGFEHERRLREHYGDRMATKYGNEWHPVVYVTLNAQASVKGLNSSLIEFYGGIVSERTPTYKLTSQVVRHVRECATTLILVDDIHYLNLRHEGAREVTNHLKQLANLTSATFVFAGVGLSETKLLTEGRIDDKVKFGQMRGRFARFPVEAFEIGSDQEKQEWLSLVKAFEDQLVLHKAYEGMCTDIAGYLHERTRGVVGALANLLRQGVDLAIDGGTERITKKLLKGVKIDEASESG